MSEVFFIVFESYNLIQILNNDSKISLAIRVLNIDLITLLGTVSLISIAEHLSLFSMSISPLYANGIWYMMWISSVDILSIYLAL